jgi:hypothetical protein
MNIAASTRQNADHISKQSDGHSIRVRLRYVALATLLVLMALLRSLPTHAQTAAPTNSDLSSYPRPHDDNGWGVHWAPVLVSQTPEEVDRYLQEIVAMDLHWVKIMQADQPNLEHVYLLKQLAQHDIQPVLRVYKTYNDPYQHLDRLVSAGVQNGVFYYELYTNPNVAGLDGGWRSGQAIDIDLLVENWTQAAQAVLSAGGYPGLPSLAPTGAVDDISFLRQFLEKLKSKNRLDILARAWLPLQNYTGNLPLTDPNGFRKFEVYHRLLLDTVGLSLPIISTEGGTIVGDVEDPKYPTITHESVAQRTTEAYRYMAEEAPDYYFAFMPWLLVNAAAGGFNGAWENHAWFPVNEQARPVVAAVKQLAAAQNKTPVMQAEPTPPFSPKPQNPKDYYGDRVQIADSGSTEMKNSVELEQTTIPGANLDTPFNDSKNSAENSITDGSAPVEQNQSQGAQSAVINSATVVSHGDVQVSEGAITLPTYGYEQAYVPTIAGDPIWPAPRIDHEMVGPPQPRSYRTIVIENDFLRLTILPELGGRIYRWEDKLTGRDILYHNQVVKPARGGIRGWWLSVGGMEWSFPLPNHGLNEYQPWKAEIVAEPRSASVRLTRDAGNGLTAQIDIGLNADRRFFAVTTQLHNSSTLPVDTHFWNNAMLAPGANNSVSAGTRLVWPASQLKVRDASDQQLSAGKIFDWPDGSGVDLRALDNWPESLSFYSAPKAEQGAVGLVDPAGELAVIRAYPHSLAPGVMGAYAPGTDPSQWTDNQDGPFFELWGGPNLDFDRPIRLMPGQAIQWTEQWYTVPNLGSFVAANANAALALHPAQSETELRLAVTGASALTSGAKLLVRFNGELIFNEPVALSTESLYIQRFAYRMNQGRWLVQLVDHQNRVLLAYDSTPEPDATLPEGIDWDNRLDQLGIKVIPAKVQPGQTYWKVTQAQFQDPQEGGGRHHIFIEVLDEDGRRLLGQKVIISWPDGSTTVTTEDKPAPEYAANFPMYGDVGSYSARMPGVSDAVTGMGLPGGRRHVVYLLTFQRTTAPGK